MPKKREIAATIQTVFQPGMKPKDLILAVRKHHSDASRKAIVRATFYALTSGENLNVDTAKNLHAFALGERVGDDD